MALGLPWVPRSRRGEAAGWGHCMGATLPGGRQALLLERMGFWAGGRAGKGEQSPAPPQITCQQLEGSWMNNFPFGLKNIPRRVIPSHSFQHFLSTYDVPGSMLDLEATAPTGWGEGQWDQRQGRM